MTEESGATAGKAPRGFPRSLVIILLGPLLGGLTAFVLFMLLNLSDPPSLDDLAYAVFSMFLITVAVGWTTGLPAAAISALIWHFVEPKLRGAMRVLAALVIGAVTSMTTSLPIIYAVFGSTFINLNGYAVIGAIGAFAMAVTALPNKKPV